MHTSENPLASIKYLWHAPIIWFGNYEKGRRIFRDYRLRNFHWKNRQKTDRTHRFSLELTRPLGKMGRPYSRWLYLIYAICDKNVGVTSFETVPTPYQPTLSGLNSKPVGCHQLLLKLGQLNEIFLMWVPEHSNIAGNEKVDRRQRYGSTLMGVEAAFAGWICKNSRGLMVGISEFLPKDTFVVP